MRDELLGIEHADEDFLVPGVMHVGLQAALGPHGAVEDMEVHGQLVGVATPVTVRSALDSRRDRVDASLKERSVGPGHRDFEIVADPTVSIADDMARATSPSAPP